MNECNDFELLADYIKALTSPDIEISPESTLSSLNIDSISLVKIFVFIENNFGVSLINKGISADDIKTVGSLMRYVRKARDA